MNEKSQILDEWLVLQARRGDQESFQQLVIKWHKKLLYQSHIRTNNWQQSEDIVQDVWQWCIANLGKLKDAGKFGSWIRTVVDRRSIDWVRQQSRRRNLDEQVILEEKNNEMTNGDAPGIAVDVQDPYEMQMAQLEKAMGQLNADNKLVLVLYYLESSSIETIAEVLDIPKGTVKSRLFHAREKLKKIIKP